MVSIAIATYNGEKYLKEQLLSICSQSLLPDEIVISDDCSTDETLSIIQDISAQYNKIKWVINCNEKNIGFALNFKKAINQCSGDIIFLSDQDDIWYDDKIEKMVYYLDKFDKIKVLFCKYTYIDYTGEILNWRYIYNNAIFFNIKMLFLKIIRIGYKNFIHNRNIPGMSLCFRKEILKKYNSIIDNHLYCHDSPLGLIASIENGLYMINKVLVKYRIHDMNAMGIGRNINGEKIDRLEWLKGKLNGIEKLQNCFIDCYAKRKKYLLFIRNEIDNCKYRIDKLRHNIFPNIFDILHYNTLLEFLCDINYVRNVKKRKNS